MPRSFALYPSIISADLLNLQKEIQLLQNECDGFHIDVMDYHFVPNLTWGQPFINAIAQYTTAPLHLHLMISQPEAFVHSFALRSGDTVIFHIEAMTAPQIIIEYLKKQQCKVAIALKPATPLETIAPYGKQVDEILLMSVQPGYSGQSFLPASMDRLKKLVQLRDQQKSHFSIVMDGGITADNLPLLVQNGLNGAAVATALFTYPDRLAALKKLYNAAGVI